MSNATLRLVAAEPNNRDVLPFERRQSPRRLISGRITSLQKSQEYSISRNRISSIQVLDISEAGLGAIADDPVALGTSIVVFFPAHGPESGFERHGHVVRCTQRKKGGYSVGIRLATRCAA